MSLALDDTMGSYMSQQQERQNAAMHASRGKEEEPERYKKNQCVFFIKTHMRCIAFLYFSFDLYTEAVSRGIL